jgi:hypothetical protein
VDSENHGVDKVSTQGKADSCGKVGDAETSVKPRDSVHQASTTALGRCTRSARTLPNLHEATAVDEIAERNDPGEGKRSADKHSDRTP